MLNPRTIALIERAAVAYRNGHPFAAARLMKLTEPLPWLLTYPSRYSDPTPNQIREYRAPRLGPAWLALREAIDAIPTTKPPAKGYFTWLVNRINRAIAGRDRPARPSQRTIHRHRQEGIYVPNNEQITEHIASPGRDWIDDAREHLDSLPLNETERQVIEMRCTGWKVLDIAPALSISLRRVSRILERVAEMVQAA